jgi:hypothetical protein
VTVDVGELAVLDGDGEALVVADRELCVAGSRAGVGEVASAPPPVPWSRRNPPRTNTTTIATAAPIHSPGPGAGRVAPRGAR